MAVAYTKKESVRLLSKSILTKLENRKAISFVSQIRQDLFDQLFDLIRPFIFTEEDLREKTLQKIGASAEAFEDSEFTDSDKYKTAKAIVKASFGDDVLNGFYYQKPMKTIAQMISKFLMKSSLIEDVFEDDDVLEKQIVEMMKSFNPAEVH